MSSKYAIWMPGPAVMWKVTLTETGEIRLEEQGGTHRTHILTEGRSVKIGVGTVSYGTHQDQTVQHDVRTAVPERQDDDDPRRAYVQHSDLRITPYAKEIFLDYAQNSFCPCQVGIDSSSALRHCARCAMKSSAVAQHRLRLQQKYEVTMSE